MTGQPPTVRQLWRSTPMVIVPFLWLLAVVYNAWLGLTFLVGGPDYVSNPDFATIRGFGGHLPVGVIFTILALLLAVSAAGDAWHMAVAFAFTGLAHLFLLAGFIAAAVSELDTAYPKVALDIIPTYFAVASTHMALARLYWFFERKADVAE